MRNETELLSEIEGGKLAESFINHPLFTQGIATLKAETLSSFESLNFRQTKEMQECNRMLATINNFEDQFIAMVQQGESALNELVIRKEHEKAMNNE